MSIYETYFHIGCLPSAHVHIHVLDEEARGDYCPYYVERWKCYTEDDLDIINLDKTWLLLDMNEAMLYIFIVPYIRTKSSVSLNGSTCYDCFLTLDEREFFDAFRWAIEDKGCVTMRR